MFNKKFCHVAEVFSQLSFFNFSFLKMLKHKVQKCFSPTLETLKKII